MQNDFAIATIIRHNDCSVAGSFNGNDISPRYDMVIGRDLMQELGVRETLLFDSVGVLNAQSTIKQFSSFDLVGYGMPVLYRSRPAIKSFQYSLKQRFILILSKPGFDNI